VVATVVATGGGHGKTGAGSMDEPALFVDATSEWRYGAWEWR
jgi:hypothetical protein